MFYPLEKITIYLEIAKLSHCLYLSELPSYLFILDGSFFFLVGYWLVS